MKSKTDSRSSVLYLTAPLSGYLMPIEQVPDPVFAQRMVGDGVSLDPVSQVLLAPCDGEVLQIHASGHALTLKTSQGIEVMMHVGLETVGLKGKGFSPNVKGGDNVRTGESLITFDADYVATHAKSLLTQIIITNGERVESMECRSGSVTAGKDVVLELMLREGPGQKQDPQGKTATSEPILIAYPNGLHARPAAVLAARAKTFPCQIVLQRDNAKANAKSVVAIMGLNVRHGDQVTFSARGEDARNAVTELTQLLRDGIKEEGAKFIPLSEPTSVSQILLPKGDDVRIGVPASPGLAVGSVVQVRREEIDVPEYGSDPRQEERKLEAAIAGAIGEIGSLRSRVAAKADAEKAAIFAAHQELLSDPELMTMTINGIGEGKSAAFAWREACRTHAQRLVQLGNDLLAARANDIRDIGRRVLRLLLDVKTKEMVFPVDTIVVAENLTPSETANLDPTRVHGFCTTTGGASSHVAILARSLGIPAVTGIDPDVLDIPDGTPVILDGTKGWLRLRPSNTETMRIRMLQKRQDERRRNELAAAHKPAITADGHRIEVAANINGLRDAAAAVASGADGVGLLRTEFLFMDRTIAPTEDEQEEAYRTIAELLGNDRPLIIRTLDIGGDKPLSYLPIAHEENPFLGDRGIRAMLGRPGLLRSQLRAILRASEAGDVRVMFPMVGLLEEWRDARKILDQERQALDARQIPVGIMVEVPSAAIQSAQFARDADFFSIGTNDLTQYTLAMDRGHPRLASKCDGLSPAVLHLIEQTVRGAGEYGRWVGVCGGLAGDPTAVPLLLGLGVHELSVSVPAIPMVKALVRRLRIADCRELAKKALSMGTSTEVRGLISVDEA